MKTAALRKLFLDFFKEKDHKIFPSDSLVPEDASLLFTSAGMNQFKPYFLGIKKDVKRAASCQKCLRMDDLEKVGKTPYHHTFFEMLGNFSFGDYFKKEAISFAWEFVNRRLNLKEDQLWVSVYYADEEAYNIWKDYIGISPERIVRLGEDKNFWPANAPALGPDGPCGPCSEIFFDQGEARGCARENCSPACNCSRFVEIWNLVFTQFNRRGKDNLEPLPQKNIDTGMGLERIASVLQGKDTNFEIDILLPARDLLIETFKLKKIEEKEKELLNAIVDYSRASIFAIADGVFPSNEERGYVVRKLIRKALVNAYLLGYTKAFLYNLIKAFAELMGEVYPPIKDKEETIAGILRAEEERFIPLLKKVDIYVSTKKEINSRELFYLYDTLGFPLEAIQSSAQKYNTRLYLEGFEGFLKEQRELSRKKSMFEETIFTKEALNLEEVTDFVGYVCTKTKAKILKILVNQKAKEFLEEKDRGLIILDRTPFYPESGGQVSDQGWIRTERASFYVEYVYKIGEAIIHQDKVIKGRLGLEEVEAEVDALRRQGLRRSHTATHLLQAVLRMVLGEEVVQQGSLVDVDRLRFDFTHFKALSPQELEMVEERVNSFILRADKVEKRIVGIEEAKKEGALAFFKEKYKEKVRLVSIGGYSKELCGGTHLDNTIEIGAFVILGESSVSSGIRRIEAVVGEEAYGYFKRIKTLQKELRGLLKCRDEDLVFNLKKILDSLKEKDQRIESLEKELVSNLAKEVIDAKKEIGGVNLFAFIFRNRGVRTLLYLLDILKQRFRRFFAFFILKSDKDNFICAVSGDLLEEGVSAEEFVKAFREELGLKGGGRKDLMQGLISKDINLEKVGSCLEGFLKK